MCNDELIDSVREQVDRLVSHTGELRMKFGDIQEEFREGNLDEAALGNLNQAIHQLETDTAAFEKILGV